MSAFPGANVVFLIRSAWRYAGERRPHMLATYALFFIGNVIACFQPVILANLINAAQTGGAGAMQAVLRLSVIYGVLSIGFWAFHGPARILERRTAFVVSRNLIARLYRVVTELPLRWHQDHHSGSTINRVRKAEKALFSFTDGQFRVLEIIIRFSVSTVLLAWYSLWVAAASIITSFGIMFAIRFFDKRLSAVAVKRNEAEHHLSGALYDYIGNIITVLTLRLQGNTGAEIQSRYDRIKIPFWKEVLLNEGKWAVINIALVFSQAMILGGYIAYQMAHSDHVALGDAVAIFQFLLTIMQQFFHGSMIFGELLFQSIDLHGVDGLVADHAKLAAAQKVGKARAWKQISVDKLTFAHANAEEGMHQLKKVSFSLQSKQKIALIGASGSGKSTLLTLLRGLYDAQDVTLTIDADKHKSLSPLAAFTTLIPQDSELFENTIHYNLTLGTEVPQAAEALALSMSAFDEVLDALPHGLETDIRERGVNLSGGQKQRLALARGLLAGRGSSLLLLDEPTSSLDPVTEQKIFDRLMRGYGDKAIIASVHRLHLLPRFDHIIYMRDGEIIEQGDFQTLLLGQGEFSKLWLTHLAQVEVG